MSSLTGLLLTEAKTHPNILAIIAMVAAALAGMAFQVFITKANASEQFDILGSQLMRTNDKLSEIETRFEGRHLETQLRTVQSELYTLERLERNGAADKTDLRHLDKYRIQRDELKRELDQVNNGRPKQ